MSLSPLHALVLTAIQQGSPDRLQKAVCGLADGTLTVTPTRLTDTDIRALVKNGDVHEVRRIALTREDLPGLPSFSAHEKKKDPRYKWYIKNYGELAWELDAMDPNDLRERVEAEILRYIDEEAWERMRWVEDAEQGTVQKMVSALAGLGK